MLRNLGTYLSGRREEERLESFTETEIGGDGS
jgi:hypothetical protein